MIGVSDLYAGFSDFMTPLGVRPTTGTVHFVQDLAGNGDVTEVIAGDTLYIKVDDADQNYNITTRQTLTVSLSTTNGDSVTVTLMETGVNTGVFTGMILTTYGSPVTGNNILEISTGETITVTYLDRIDASNNLNQYRTDTVLVLGPVVSVSKTVNLSEVSAGETVVYTVTVTNTGTAAAVLTSIQDLLPSGFSYITGSSLGLTAVDPAINGQILTWQGNWVISEHSSANLVFKVLTGGTSGTFYNSVTVSGNNFPAANSGNTAAVTVGAPLLSLVKQVNKISAAPGEEIIYSIHYKNVGAGNARTIVITDNIPLNTTYVAGSLRLGSASSTYETATPLTDIQDADAGHFSAGAVFFIFSAVSAGEEGKVYFKVVVQ